MNLSKIIKVMDDNCHKRKGCGGCLASTPNTYTLKGYTVGKCMLSELRSLEKERCQSIITIYEEPVVMDIGESSGPTPVPPTYLKGE